MTGYTPSPRKNSTSSFPGSATATCKHWEFRCRRPLLHASDTATSQKVAIVNESFVRHYFGGAPPRLGTM